MTHRKMTLAGLLAAAGAVSIFAFNTYSADATPQRPDRNHPQQNRRGINHRPRHPEVRKALTQAAQARQSMIDSEKALGPHRQAAIDHLNQAMKEMRAIIANDRP